MFSFKKIASVLTGAVMLTSTLAFAAAANYPAPFVKSGSSDVAIVYGSNPGADVDLVAVLDINADLSGALAAQTASSSGSAGSSSISGGDYIVLSKSSDKVNLGNIVSSVFGTTVGDDDLSVLLKDGKYSNDENTEFDYEQKFTLGGLTLDSFADSDYKDSLPTVGFNMSSDSMILNYTLDFTTDPDSDVSSGDLVDIETTNLEILGRNYYILDVDNSTLDLTLMDSANSAILKEGESTTVEVGDNSYTASINFIGSTSVKLDINGEVTNSLSNGGTQKLKDGSYVGIKDILVQDYAGGSKQVEFSIGSGKLEIKGAAGSQIELNDDSVEALTSSVVRGTPASGREKIDKIILTWTAQDNEFITGDQELVMPGLKSVKFSASAFGGTATEVTNVQSGASTYMRLKAPVKDGEVNIPFIYTDTTAAQKGNFTGIGKDSTHILKTVNGTYLEFNETQNHDRIIASWNSTTEAESYYLKFTFTTQDSINKTTITQDLVSGDKVACKDKKPGDTCDIGSLTLTINNVEKYGGKWTVNMTGNSGSSFNQLFTNEGLQVYLPWESANDHTVNGTDVASTLRGAINLTQAQLGGANTSIGHNKDTWIMSFVEEDKDDNIGKGTNFSVVIDDNSNEELEVSSIPTAATAGNKQQTDPDDSNHKIARVFSDLATKVEQEGQSSDQRTATITYLGSEAFADLILTDAMATVSNTEGTSSSSGSVKELGAPVYKDTEVAQVSSNNLIVVGGSCVNTLAAELLGGIGCGQSFEDSTSVGSGSFLIQTFERTGGKIATLVAGYNAQDTVNAAKYLTTQDVDTSVGKKYVGTSATSAQLTTTAAVDATG
ncbi:hypothetical protein COU54_04960 [Candidatus Pacearchaeota archaeon CG10_big_fil_rev_8_21_14_0_10_31_24]|nr:MAG: hypothetical protein COU54_04960 [Candidatus Pacearchaeota archaeon CG10_big_fil_rev_8_21_14_0_10_31_24]